MEIMSATAVLTAESSSKPKTKPHTSEKRPTFWPCSVTVGIVNVHGHHAENGVLWRQVPAILEVDRTFE